MPAYTFVVHPATRLAVRGPLSHTPTESELERLGVVYDIPPHTLILHTTEITPTRGATYIMPDLQPLRVATPDEALLRLPPLKRFIELFDTLLPLAVQVLLFPARMAVVERRYAVARKIINDTGTTATFTAAMKTRMLGLFD